VNSENVFQAWFCLALLLVMCSSAGLAEAVSSLNPLETLRRFRNDHEARRQAKLREPFEREEEKLTLQRKESEIRLVKNEGDLGRINVASKFLELLREADASGTSVEDLAWQLAVLYPAGRPDSGQKRLPAGSGYGQLPPCTPVGEPEFGHGS
jgi:hypothetical protein